MGKAWEKLRQNLQSYNDYWSLSEVEMTRKTIIGQDFNLAFPVIPCF